MKLAFWKKDKFEMEKELGLPTESDTGLAFKSPVEHLMPETSEPKDFSHQPFASSPFQPLTSSPQPEAFGEQKSYQQHQAFEKDIQLILTKLDLMNSKLDNLNHRIAALEKIAQGETEHRQEYGQYGRF